MQNLVELQGEIELSPGEGPRMRQKGFEVGQCKGDPKATVALTVGNHELRGDNVKLRKPILVLERSTDASGAPVFVAKGILR